MPLYQYACENGCGNEIEILSNAPTTKGLKCKRCGLTLVRQFSAPMIRQGGYKAEEARHGRGLGHYDNTCPSGQCVARKSQLK